VEDIDGDGRMLMMRIPDPNGNWKKHPDEPRLMIRRDPDEVGGEYYRILPEGRFDEPFDPAILTIQPKKEGLDLNRNFPAHWRQEHEQEGAGPYPTSEPEVRAIVDFIVKHPNITGGVTFHTWSGVLLRPYSHQPDDAFPAEDLWTYQKIGAKGTEITGYPNISVYHDFKYHPKEYISGVFDDWMYDHMGVFAWTVEIWSPQRQAGITDYKFIDWYREHPVEDDLKLLKWSDEVLGGRGYVDWYPFEHPQLGRVELGGWDMLYAWRNPPPEFLEKEVALFPDWLVWHLLISPKLRCTRRRWSRWATRFTRCAWWCRTRAGCRPTSPRRHWRRSSCAGDCRDRAARRRDAPQLGKPREELGQLEGRAYKPSAVTCLERRPHRRPREGGMGRARAAGRHGAPDGSPRARGGCARRVPAGVYRAVKRNSRSPLGGRAIKPCSASGIARLPVRMSAIACSKGISTPSCAASVCAASAVG
jgi:murein tripeptide amidase MpaA